MAFLEKLWMGWKQFKNERLYRRVPVSIPVTVRVQGQESTRNEQIGNWSPGGLFITTKEPLPLETSIELEFPLGKEGGSTLKLTAQVVRHQSSQTGEIEGMGVMFTDFAQSGLMILRDLLTKSYSEVSPS